MTKIIKYDDLCKDYILCPTENNPSKHSHLIRASSRSPHTDPYLPTDLRVPYTSPNFNVTKLTPNTRMSLSTSRLNELFNC